MRSEKGITLVALIITIIVMLILVTVSVTVALQTGLFTSASDAAENTQKAVNAETELSDGKVNVGAFSGNISDINLETNF